MKFKIEDATLCVCGHERSSHWISTYLADYNGCCVLMPPGRAYSSVAALELIRCRCPNFKVDNYAYIKRIEECRKKERK